MRKISRRKWWTIAVVVGAVILVILLVLIAVGVLVLPGQGPAAPVKVQVVCVSWLQGTNSTGAPWFGTSKYCFGGVANNLPYSSAAGSVVNIPIPVLNYDTVSHTIYSVQVGPPFTLQRTSPPLPFVVASYTTNPEGIDGGLMTFVVLPSTPGAALGLNVTINALGAP
jgi:hypothetical protein